MRGSPRAKLNLVLAFIYNVSGLRIGRSLVILESKLSQTFLKDKLSLLVIG